MLKYITTKTYNSAKFDTIIAYFKKHTIRKIQQCSEIKKTTNTNKYFLALKNVCISQMPADVSKHNMLFFKIYIEYTNKSYKFLRILYNLPIKKIKTHNVSRKKK